MKTFTIKSNVSDLALEFSDIESESFTVRLESNHISASRKVYDYPDIHRFPDLLERLALHDKPWDGEISWESLEGEFKFSASCSSLGSVTFRVMLNSYFGGEDWNVETIILSEMGQLQVFARSARLFFGATPS